MIWIGFLLFFCVDDVIKGHPLQPNNQNIKTDIPILFVNVTMFQRGGIPILIPKNNSHELPLTYHTSTGPRNEHGYNKTKDVCYGLIKRFVPEIMFIFDRSHFDVNEYCATIIGNDDCMGGKSLNADWKVSLPLLPKPTQNDLRLPKRNVPTFKVLHITDTHYDPLYVEGANALCRKPLCCRDEAQKIIDASHAAGKWGDYRNCDPPKTTIDNMFDHIVQQHPDIDYIIWTGDIQPHNVWSDSKEENLKLLREMVATIKEKFPNIPIFPAIGNHETSPANNFPPPYIKESKFLNTWLLDEIDVQWRNWLPENVSPTIKFGGFYSVLVRPGFRILSINTNYCYSANFWLLMNATDPASELQWLVYELQAAELGNEKVHIIGHIPPGYVDCMRIWSKNYYKIIGRFEATVTGQFFGHTHGDEIEVFYDPDDLHRATNILYIAPSVTPYSNFNPGYKIYYVDGDHADTTRMIIDKEGWTFDLDDANIKGTPHWYKLYSARSSYGMDGLRPSDWNKFISKMRTNDEIFDLYHKHYWRDSPKRPLCEGNCKKQFICNAKSGRSHDRKVLCENMEN